MTVRPTFNQRLTAHPLTVPLSALTLVALLWWIGPLAYPLRLFTTIVHELAHGLAALLSGGDFVAFRIAPDGSGLAYTRGGLRALIIPAGYLGTALIGALLVRLSRHLSAARWTLAAVGLLTSLLTARYALPVLFTTDVLYGALTLLSGIGFGLGLVWAARRFSQHWTHWLLTVLGSWLGLSSIEDLLTLLSISVAPFDPALRSDAMAMAEISGIPAVVWALLWLAIGVYAVGWALFGRLRSR